MIPRFSSAIPIPSRSVFPTATTSFCAEVSAYDNQDGDLTSGIVIGGISKLISDNTAKITYMVFDSDNNMARMTRLVKYTDYKKPYFYSRRSAFV